MNSIFKFEDDLIYLEKVNFIKRVDKYDQVYMDMGLIHLPISLDIKTVFEQYVREKGNVKSTMPVPPGFPQPI